MTVTIRLEADWGLLPYFVDDGDDRFEAYTKAGFARRFALPGPVVSALEDWNQLYQRILDWDDPRISAFADAEAERHFYEQGRVVSRLLRRHVPAEVRIMYVGDGNIPAEYYQ
jgi:hypothetical protein